MLTFYAALSLLAWFYLAFFHGGFWKLLLDEAAVEPAFWPAVDVIVPARDEADVLPRSLGSLLDQDYPGAWRVLLIDDHSQDGTTDVARQIAAKKGKEDRLCVIAAPDLPEGWTGKVAAMQAGVAQSEAPYLLFTDADIGHVPQSLRRLMARSLQNKLDLNSLMVKLHCKSFAEKLLIPSFVFFFAMLYPFRKAGDIASRVAAAAGGVMLVRAQALRNAGGLAEIKNALIDDCSLARLLKDKGGDDCAAGAIRLTLTERAQSLRVYPRIGDIWDMIARTAYTQLHYSPVLLLGTVLGMGLMFLAPVPLTFLSPFSSAFCGFMDWILMSLLYAPMVRFYKLPSFWTFLLPLAALIYLGATMASAFRSFKGKGGQWKGRIQES